MSDDRDRRIAELERELASRDAELASRDAVIVSLRSRLAELLARVEDLEERSRRSSRNTSRPPSTDGPEVPTRRARRRRQREGEKARKRGGQEDHPGHSRSLFAEDQLTGREDLPLPHDACPCCGGRLVGLEPLVHQVADLPPLMVEVIEYRIARARCQGCKRTHHADLPDGVTMSPFGPRLSAMVVTMRFRHKMSIAHISEFVGAVIGCPISTGAVQRVCERAATMLAHPYQAILDTVRAAAVVHADETSWKCAGEKRWLWAAATSTHAAFMIRPDRSQASANALLLDTFDGVLIVDRYGGYNQFPIRQFCWSHLGRDLQKVAERSDRVSAQVGAKLVKHERAIHRAWRAFQEHNDRDRLKADLEPIQQCICDLLVKLSDSPNDKTATFAINLLAHWEKLWLFVTEPDVCPTNNHAERLVRHPVTIRKLSGGSRTKRGENVTETLLSVIATCNLQQRCAFTYLANAFTAAARGDPIPTL